MTRLSRPATFAVALVCLAFSIGSAQGEDFVYRAPDKINETMAQVVKQNNSLVSLLTLAQTPGGRDLQLLELGAKNSSLPAIMVVANMEGDSPIASEAALRLAHLLTSDWKEELDLHRWYILPCGNPDGHARYYQTPLVKTFVNDKSTNADQDDATDEDGPEDLNGDGFITSMRQEHPEGRWVEVADNPLFLREADGAKGEAGKYRLYEEGIDNDSDGRINEDGPGGANPGHNFPHDFKHFTETDGLWAASENESRAVLQFAFDHPEIAMILVFGRTNTLIKVPESQRQAEASQSKYKMPERWAKRTGLDPDIEYPLKDLLVMARDITGYKDLTEDMLLQWLDAGAAVNPDTKDVAYWKEISKKYNEFIKEAELDAKRLDPPGFSNGSVEEWAYYQYGVPTFCMDFWTLPEPAKEESPKDDSTLSLDELEKMSSEEVIGLGEEKIAALLKAQIAPEQFTAERVIQGLESGRMTPERMARMMRKQAKDDDDGKADEEDEALYAFNPDAYLEWQSYDHPTLGPVEIGGKKPYADMLPPADRADELIAKQLPFVRELAGMLPRIVVKEIKTTRRSSGVWKVEAWIANEGFLPYPTYQGKRSQRPSPVVAILSGRPVDFIEGRPRQVVGLLDGSGGVEKVSWLVKGTAGSEVTVEAHSFAVGSNKKAVSLKEGK